MNIIVELNTYQPPMVTFDGVTQDGKEYHMFMDRETGQPDVNKKKTCQRRCPSKWLALSCFFNLLFITQHTLEAFGIFNNNSCNTRIYRVPIKPYQPTNSSHEIKLRCCGGRYNPQKCKVID